MERMKVLYDFQMLYAQRYGGITRYFYELASRMRRDGLAQVDVPCLFNMNAYFEDYFGKKYNPLYGKLRGRFFVNKLNTILAMKTRHYDIVHPTYYNPYIIGKSKAKLVLTVYDMIHELFPEYFEYDKITIPNKKKMIFAADQIIAISENTKKDILRIYPEISPDKITVIYLGSSFQSPESDYVYSDERFPENYILFVGLRGAYKNFARFFKAVAPVLKENSDLYLVCCGGGGG